MHELTKYRIEEYAERDKSISYKLAWYMVKAEELDGMIRLMMQGEWSKKEMMAFLKVSERFMEISMKRHSKEGGGEEEGAAQVMEQIAEVRAMELKHPEMKQDKELFEKERYLRMGEKEATVKIFLRETNYSPERIAELVGVSVRLVECYRELLGVK